MSLTLTYSISTNAQSSIGVNHMRYTIYKKSNLAAIFQSQSFAPPHNARTVTFPALPKDNYRYILQEVLPDDVTVIRQMDLYDFVPGANDIIYYSPIEIQADFTVGMISATNTFTFDGTAGTFDWRGRDIYPERVGQGTMQKGIQYSWDKINGIFLLLQTDDVFAPGELFNIEFGIISTTFDGILPTSLFSGVLIISGATTLTAADIGKKIIIKGASSTFDITLPDASLCPDAIPTYFESSIGNHINVRIKTVGGQLIDWLKGARVDIKIGVCESISIYKEPLINGWRIHEADGNFRTVGQFIISDGDITANQFNCLLLDGSAKNTDVYCRLYEDFVQKLPPAQLCSFATHGVGDNIRLFSLASGGQFFVPDLRNLYIRNWDGTNLAGAYMSDTSFDHRHETTIGLLPTTLFGRGSVARLRGTYEGSGTGVTELTSAPIKSDGGDISGKFGDETKPKSRVSLIYVLI